MIIRFDMVLITKLIENLFILMFRYYVEKREKMVTKKQHYYPRTLLKHFSDVNNKVNVYIRKGDKFRRTSYEKICAANNTYEADGIVDNILESKLSIYETKMGAIVEDIIKNPYLEVSKENQNFIFTFIRLQSIRTDVGRIHLMDLLKNPFLYKPRKFPTELEEIEKNKVTINEFNRIFKKGSNLNTILTFSPRPISMKFYIALTDKNLITSDNPVTANDQFKQLILPIHPNICIEFLDESTYHYKVSLIRLTDEKVDYLNKATINPANYFVISNQPFTEEEREYISMRCKNPKSIRKHPFFEIDE